MGKEKETVEWHKQLKTMVLSDNEQLYLWKGASHHHSGHLF